MNIETVGRNYNVDDRVREFVAEKLKRIEKFVDDPTEVRVTLVAEKRTFTAEIHVRHRHGTLQATEQDEANMFEAIQLATAKAEKQARRDKTKQVDQRRRAAATDHWPLDVLEAGSLGGDSGPRVIKSSRLEIKPMTIEEAALKLSDSRHEFVVFLDSSSERISVLYRRKDNNFGLIAPEF